MRHFIHSGRRRVVCRSLAASHPQIPLELHRAIFPLYNPSSVDVLVFWEIPSQGRSGHVLVTGLTLGASHAPLRELIEDMETAKVKRDMYAETRRERLDVLDSVKRSEWNVAMNPLAVIVKDGAIVNHDFTKGYACQLYICYLLTKNPAQVYSDTSDLHAAKSVINKSGALYAEADRTPRKTTRTIVSESQ